MSLLAYLIYLPLQIVWLPISLLGGLWVAYKQLVVSKRLGVSQTAVEILNGRWSMDVFGLRADPVTRKLARVLPNNSTIGLFLTLFPLFAQMKTMLSSSSLWAPAWTRALLG